MLTRNEDTEISRKTRDYLTIVGEFCFISFILIPITIFQFDTPLNLSYYFGFISALAVLGTFSPYLITIAARLFVPIALASVVGKLLVVQFLHEDTWILALSIFFSGFLLLTVLFWDELFKVFWISVGISSVTFIIYSVLMYFM